MVKLRMQKRLNWEMKLIPKFSTCKCIHQILS